MKNIDLNVLKNFLKSEKFKKIPDTLKDKVFITTIGALFYDLFIEEKPSKSKLEFNDYIFAEVLIRLKRDRNRIAIFHGLKRIDEIKMVSYFTYWIVKLKPI